MTDSFHELRETCNAFRDGEQRALDALQRTRDLLRTAMIRGRELAEYMQHYKYGGTPQVTALQFFLTAPADQPAATETGPLSALSNYSVESAGPCGDGDEDGYNMATGVPTHSDVRNWARAAERHGDLPPVLVRQLVKYVDEQEATLAATRRDGQIVAAMWDRMGRNARAGFPDEELDDADEASRRLQELRGDDPSDRPVMLSELAAFRAELVATLRSAVDGAPDDWIADASDFRVLAGRLEKGGAK